VEHVLALARGHAQRPTQGLDDLLRRIGRSALLQAVLHAVKTIEADGGLDVLVNNAAIEERAADNAVIGPSELTVEAMRKTFDTNVFGTVRVTNAFLPLLQRSAMPVVVNVSSGLGSLTQFVPAPRMSTRAWPTRRRRPPST
jgi:NAD(P)-dependent dehydrogenase (short-subunit alcohol dehydrogenase family)